MNNKVKPLHLVIAGIFLILLGIGIYFIPDKKDNSIINNDNNQEENIDDEKTNDNQEENIDNEKTNDNQEENDDDKDEEEIAKCSFYSYANYQDIPTGNISKLEGEKVDEKI